MPAPASHVHAHVRVGSVYRHGVDKHPFLDLLINTIGPFSYASSQYNIIEIYSVQCSVIPLEASDNVSVSINDGVGTRKGLPF